jgi:opacity protein-like surface antigen
MRSVKFLIAAGAASLLSSVAFAADMPSIMPPPPMAYAPAPAQDFGGWYLRGDIGFSNQSVSKRDYYSYPTLLSLQQQSSFDTGGIFGVGVGYQFNNWFRADVTGQYRGKANFHGLDLTSYSDTGTVQRGSDNYSASKSEIVVLGNVYADLGTWWCMTPFVGAGVGMSRNTISNFTDTGANGTLAFGTVPSLASAASASKWNFAWALHTGVAYHVTPSMVVELAYSYMNLGDGLTGALVTKDGVTANQAMTFKDITSHDVKLGVRWNFDSAPQPVYAPPLMRKG